MRTISLLWMIILALTACNNQHSKAPEAPIADKQPGSSKPVLPRPLHVLVLIMENHSFAEIFESKDAPNFNTLVKEPQSVLFTQSYAVSHPSLPNYLALFSGDTQGCTDDEIPANAPYTTPNLAHQLMDSGYTFAVYSEDLPEAGYDGKWAAGHKYARKHNPAPDWVGNGANQISPETNQPFTAFPVSDFDSLPTVCFVVPNQDNDMHDGTIAQADSWYAKHIEAYRKWADNHNSLLIVTFDEDDDSADNHITTIFSGAAVKGGADSMHITHYSVLRTIEDFYNLPYAGHAADSHAIDNCWK